MLRKRQTNNWKRSYNKDWLKGKMICDKCKQGFTFLFHDKGKRVCYNCCSSGFNYDYNAERRDAKKEMKELIKQYKEKEEKK